MAVKVSVSRDTEHRDIAQQYANFLQDWKNTGVLPSRFGRDGQWELNSRTVDSNIFKLHIRLPDEPAWKKHKPQLARTSNHYLVYVIHWLNADRIQIISIMSPNAHEKANSSFLAALECRAEAFHNS
ncbi:type II toxin-antitoxin system YafO family toxin [Salmonella enterica]|nr:type II toxin-antitoxin system YafO family toxin [Salmonella enterica]EKS2298083.1 type II toxin-antitoxin system YafO family toxin [Salmonella enterica]EKS2420457.1 type II toxin-antitoxin system YafO family toxin [Salmonella enterica]